MYWASKQYKRMDLEKLFQIPYFCSFHHTRGDCCFSAILLEVSWKYWCCIFLSSVSTCVSWTLMSSWCRACPTSAGAVMQFFFAPSKNFSKIELFFSFNTFLFKHFLYNLFNFFFPLPFYTPQLIRFRKRTFSIR